MRCESPSSTPVPGTKEGPVNVVAPFPHELAPGIAAKGYLSHSLHEGPGARPDRKAFGVLASW